MDISSTCICTLFGLYWFSIFDIVLVLQPALVSVGRSQSFKRCAYHVYISHLIRSYQSVEKKNRPPSVNQSKFNEGKTSGITSSNEPTVVKTDINNVMSIGTHGVVADKKWHDARLGTLQNNKLLQDQQVSTSSGIYPQQKQVVMPLWLRSNYP